MNTFVAMDKIMYSIYVKKILVNYDDRKIYRSKLIESLLEPLECLHVQICTRII